MKLSLIMAENVADGLTGWMLNMRIKLAIKWQKLVTVQA
jgi:hypothetical protein